MSGATLVEISEISRTCAADDDKAYVYVDEDDKPSRWLKLKIIACSTKIRSDIVWTMWVGLLKWYEVAHDRTPSWEG